MSFLRTIGSSSTAIASVLVALLPLAVGLDFGGVLWWTQYAATVVVALAFLLSIPSLLPGAHSGRLRQVILVLPLSLWWLYAWLQTKPLSPSTVDRLSPGSFDAYTTWLEGIIPKQDLPSAFPVSISTSDSLHAVAVLSMLIPLSWVSAMIFQSRRRMIWLLSAVAISGTMVSAVGIVRLAFPNLPLFDFFANSTPANTSFGPFVNRNNAALMLNIGLAASLGLLSWRLTALTGQEVDDETFEFNDLLSLIGDRASTIGILGAACCLAGLLIGGSRSGLGAALVGTLLAFGWIRTRRGLSAIPVVGITIGVAVLILVIPLQLDFESIKRLKVINTNTETILNNGRFEHWPAGWETAMAHLPAGAGLSTYAYAYLPHQKEGAFEWFHHADNLWLELFVEQGIPGLLICLSVTGIFIWALLSMSRSHDPLDQGIRTTGWFLLGAILFSQSFDFGLIIPANLFLVVVVVSASVGHSAFSLNTDTSDPLETRNKRHFLTFGRALVPSTIAPFVHRWLSPSLILTIPCIAGAALYFSIPRLRQDAAAEGEIRATQLVLDNGYWDAKVVQSLQTRLKGIQNPSPDTWNLLADLQHRQGRLEEVEAQSPSTSAERTILREATSPSVRRLAERDKRSLEARPDLAAALGSINEQPQPAVYRSARETYIKALKLRPIELRARSGLLYLDFASDNPDSTEILLSQMRVLLKNNPSELNSLAKFSAQSGLNELASQLWNETLVLSPRFTRGTMKDIALYPDVDTLACLPRTPEVMRLVAQEALANPKTDWNDLLPIIIDEIDCEQFASVSEKAECLQLHGDLAYALERYEAAFNDYREAISLTPRNANLRFKTADRLREAGRRREALQEARTARRLIPEDERFDRLIDQMAARDIE